MSTATNGLIKFSDFAYGDDRLLTNIKSVCNSGETPFLQNTNQLIVNRLFKPTRSYIGQTYANGTATLTCPASATNVGRSGTNCPCSYLYFGNAYREDAPGGAGGHLAGHQGLGEKANAKHINGTQILKYSVTGTDACPAFMYWAAVNSSTPTASSSGSIGTTPGDGIGLGEMVNAVTSSKRPTTNSLSYGWSGGVGIKTNLTSISQCCTFVTRKIGTRDGYTFFTPNATCTRIGAVREYSGVPTFMEAKFFLDRISTSSTAISSSVNNLTMFAMGTASAADTCPTSWQASWGLSFLDAEWSYFDKRRLAFNVSNATGGVGKWTTVSGGNFSTLIDAVNYYAQNFTQGVPTTPNATAPKKYVFRYIQQWFTDTTGQLKSCRLLQVSGNAMFFTNGVNGFEETTITSAGTSTSSTTRAYFTQWRTLAYSNPANVTTGIKEQLATWMTTNRNAYLGVVIGACSSVNTNCALTMFNLTGAEGFCEHIRRGKLTTNY